MWHAFVFNHQTILKLVTVFERHDTFSAFHHAVALKLFLALLLNTGLTVVIVNAKLSTVTLPPEVGIFSGQFTSFEPNWYSGPSLCATSAGLQAPMLYGTLCFMCTLCLVCVSR
jgi:hypothetical protein